MTDGGPEPTRLLVLRSARRFEEDAEVCELEIEVPPDLRWFRGHFPDDPVLPAVVQLREVAAYVASTWSELARPRAMIRLKFRSRIRPADRIRVLLRRVRNSNCVSFEMSAGAAPTSSGTLEYAP